MGGGQQGRGQQEEEGEEADAHVLGHKAEEERHQTGSQRRPRHLHTDHRLGFIRAEEGRGGVYGAGVDGGAAQAGQCQPRQGGDLPEGQQQRQHPRQKDPDAQTDQLTVGEPQSQEAAGHPAQGDADKIGSGEAGRCLRRDAPLQSEVAAGPEVEGLLDRKSVV